MKLFKTFWNSAFAFGFAIGLVMSAGLQGVDAQTNDTAGPNKACVKREGLSFNGVGLWTRLPAVLKRYGKPLRIEPMPSVNKNRVNATYYYKDVKLLIFNSIVWKITVLTDAIATKSGIRLFTEYTQVERMLAVNLKSINPKGTQTGLYKAPICPPDPPEVEEFVVLKFDQNYRLQEFIVEGVFP
jgi:hypothetical protein